MEKQYLKRTCDSPVCDTVDIIEQGNENVGILSRWIFIVTSEIVAVPQGPGKMPKPQLQQNIKQACRPLCAINILKTAVEPSREEKRMSLEDLQKLARGEKIDESQSGAASKSDEVQPETAPAQAPAPAENPVPTPKGSGSSLTA